MRSIALICLLFASFSPALAADKKAEDIVTQHLDSIGTAEARVALKSLGVQGTLRFKIIVGGAGETTGNWQHFSEQRKSNFAMKFGGSDWWGERFVFDGDKTYFAAATSSHQRSAFGEFVRTHDFIIKDGLLGGELSTNWALQGLALQGPDGNRIKLDYLGVKKIDGRDVQAIEYLSKSNGEMTVTLYFDPETYHHVMTIFSVMRGAIRAHHTDTASAHEQEVHYTIEERFSNFQTDNGITLPRHYDLQFNQQPPSGKTSVYDWDMTADKIFANPKIAPANFQEKQ